jgi:hypothetical protein
MISLQQTELSQFTSQSVGVFSGSALSDTAEVPPLTAILKTMQERSTIPLALEIGVASIMRWKHNGLMVRYRPTRGVVTTSKPVRSPFPMLISLTGVRSRARLSPQPKLD